MAPTYVYKALDCYVISRTGNRITFVVAPADEGTPSKEYDLDLDEPSHVDINKWQDPRGFTSVGDDGHGGFATVGGVWLTAAWIAALPQGKVVPTLDDDYPVAVYDESPDRRYMGFDVAIDGWSGAGNTVLSFTRNQETDDIDIGSSDNADRHTTDGGLTEARYDNGGTKLVYFSPRAIDDSAALADPKKPTSTGSTDAPSPQVYYRIPKAHVAVLRPTGVATFVENPTYILNPAYQFQVSLRDGLYADAAVWTRPIPGFTTIGHGPAGARYTGEVWVSDEWLATVEGKPNAPDPGSTPEVALYRDGRRYLSVEVKVLRVSGDVVSFEYDGGKTGTVDLRDRWLVDAHGSRGKTTVNGRMKPGAIGLLYLSPMWFAARRK